MKNGPYWQCPHSPMPHFMFRSMERNIRSSRTPRAWSSRTVKRIITSGPQTRATLLAGSKGARGMSVVTTPTLPPPFPPPPVPRRGVHGHRHVQVHAAAPPLQLAHVEEITRRARAVEKDDAAELLPAGEQPVQGGAQRRQADAAGHDHHVDPFRLVYRPGGAEGAAQI